MTLLAIDFDKKKSQTVQRKKNTIFFSGMTIKEITSLIFHRIYTIVVIPDSICVHVYVWVGECVQCIFVLPVGMQQYNECTPPPPRIYTHTLTHTKGIKWIILYFIHCSK